MILTRYFIVLSKNKQFLRLSSNFWEKGGFVISTTPMILSLNEYNRFLQSDHWIKECDIYDVKIHEVIINVGNQVLLEVIPIDQQKIRYRVANSYN